MTRSPARQESKSETLWIQEKKDEISEMRKVLERFCGCVKLATHTHTKKLSPGKQLRKTGQARILSRSYPCGLTLVACSSDLCSLGPLCFICLFKIAIWTHFWGVEAGNLEFVGSLLLLLFFCIRPLQAFVFPAWPFMASTWVWYPWDSGQPDPEPRISEDYPRQSK